MVSFRYLATRNAVLRWPCIAMACIAMACIAMALMLLTQQEGSVVLHINVGAGQSSALIQTPLLKEVRHKEKGIGRMIAMDRGGKFEPHKQKAPWLRYRHHRRGVEVSTMQRFMRLGGKSVSTLITNFNFAPIRGIFCFAFFA